jgi:hypothetical protein
MIRRRRRLPSLCAGLLTNTRPCISATKLARQARVSRGRSPRCGTIAWSWRAP